MRYCLNLYDDGCEFNKIHFIFCDMDALTACAETCINQGKKVEMYMETKGENEDGNTL